MFYLICPECEARNETVEDLTGVRIKCGHCSHIFIVETVSRVEAAPQPASSAKPSVRKKSGRKKGSKSMLRTGTMPAQKRPGAKKTGASSGGRRGKRSLPAQNKQKGMPAYIIVLIAAAVVVTIVVVVLISSSGKSKPKPVKKPQVVKKEKAEPNIFLDMLKENRKNAHRNK